MVAVALTVYSSHSIKMGSLPPSKIPTSKERAVFRQNKVRPHNFIVTPTNILSWIVETFFDVIYQRNNLL